MRFPIVIAATAALLAGQSVAWGQSAPDLKGDWVEVGNSGSLVRRGGPFEHADSTGNEGLPHVVDSNSLETLGKAWHGHATDGKITYLPSRSKNTDAQMMSLKKRAARFPSHTSPHTIARLAPFPLARSNGGVTPVSIMSSLHKFKIGQVVRYRQHRVRIIRRLDLVGGKLAYQIRHETDPKEWVVRENELYDPNVETRGRARKS